MTALVLDAGGLSRLAERSRAAAALHQELHQAGLWPPVVPSAVVVEATSGHGPRDAAVNRLLKACDIDEVLSTNAARRAAHLRTAAGRGSAVDAIVVGRAEGGGSVLTADVGDLGALAAAADGVLVVPA